jgi:putative ABC transport system permease protein
MRKKLLRWALRLSPRSFRHEFDSEIEADFEEGWREARARGRVKALAFTLRTLGDVGRSGLGESWESRPRRKRMQPMVGPDAKLALRGIYRSPGFTALTVLALALGIGANTAIFSVVNAVLLSPLPYERSSELVRIWSSRAHLPLGGVSEPEYYDYGKSESIESIGAFIFPHDASLAFEAGEPEPVKRTFVTASLFRVLRADALHGRTFEDEENEPGKGDVAVLSHGLWQRKFASDPGVVGRTVRVQASPVTVVGVMPPWFQYPDADVDLWLPLTLIPERPRPRGAHFLRVVGRLKAGASLESARTELGVVAAQLELNYPDGYPGGSGLSVLVLPLADDLVAEVRPALLILLAAVGFVLLIACANVANLLLARAAGRERELALRRTLGASRWSVARLILTESVIVSLLSGAASLLLAYFMMGALLALAPADVPRLSAAAIDSRVLAFTLTISVLTGIGFGTLPAWGLSRASAGSVLGTPLHLTFRGARRRAQRALIASEVALTVALLVGAGLLLRSFENLVHVDPGFEAAPLAMARLSLPTRSYPDRAARARFFDELRRNLEGVAGVDATAFVSNPPLSGFASDAGFYVEGVDDPSFSGSEEYREVSSGYFRTLSIPLLAGRELDRHDDAEAPPVVVVSESFAHKYWKGGNPVGRRIKMGDRESKSPWLTVVGVVGDVRHGGLGASAGPIYYRPLVHAAEEITLIVRAHQEPEPILASIREEVKKLDRDLAAFGVETMEDRIAMSIARPRFNLTLITLFALLALVLASVGIYGLTRYAVTQRTSEIGVRVAFGASRSRILRMVLAEALATAGLGLVLGILASAGLSRALASVPDLLHGVTAIDLPTYAGVVVVLLAAVLVASFPSASRASRLPPVDALRHE